MNARYLIARWICDGVTWPITPDERQAVGRLRFDAALRLPADERAELLRLLDPAEPTNPTPLQNVDLSRQEGLLKWH